MSSPLSRRTFCQKEKVTYGTSPEKDSHLHYFLANSLSGLCALLYDPIIRCHDVCCQNSCMSLFVPFQLRRRPQSTVWHRARHGRIDINSLVYDKREDPAACNGFVVDRTTPIILKTLHGEALASPVDSEISTDDDYLPPTNQLEALKDSDEITYNGQVSSYTNVKPEATRDFQNKNSDMSHAFRSAKRELASRSTSATDPNEFEANGLALGRSRVATDAEHFDILYQSASRSDAWSKIVFVPHLNEIRVTFIHFFPGNRYRIFVLHVLLSDIRSELVVDTRDEREVLTIYTRVPPRCMCLTKKPKANLYMQNGQSARNMEEQASYEISLTRVCEIFSTGDPESRTTGPILMFHKNCLFELGRCNTIEITLAPLRDTRSRLSKFLRRIEEQNLRWLKRDRQLIRKAWAVSQYTRQWQLLYGNTKMPFDVRYLLEVAISQGSIDESQFESILPLLESADARAAKDCLTQIIFANKTTGTSLEDLRALLRRSLTRSDTLETIPPYCCRVRKVVVTVSSIRILLPHVEVSNRILRQYAGHIEYFLRVQFLDEIGHGQLFGGESQNSEPYLRVFRTLSKGISVAGRKYDFLAFGNSQLREHGVFMFAECPGALDCGIADCTGLKASHIRMAIGDVSDIKIVAKQAARVGQVFSTTKVISDKSFAITPVRIDDWVGGDKGQFCFSDGVGLTSEAILAEVARELDNEGHRLSAIQFRFGGAKGVLALTSASSVLPQGRLPLRDRQVALRPSQIKFESAHDRLEVIRVAKYRAATLNRQFIVVLWSLGVDTSAFLRLQETMISELDLSLTDEQVALRCLRRHVDEHGSTVLLGEMVAFGFMARGDPFVNQVLRLFRNWSLKALKEKAKITIEKGCHLMGICDESSSLRGHYDRMYDQDDRDLHAMDLPEIFLQITDVNDPKKYRVIQQICIIGRAPALHPGDMRLVRAVDKPELRHLHNVLVFPSSGDQDVPSMCSGGDLDGDDYTIIWDHELFPIAGKRYIRPMDYAGPPPKVADPIYMQDIIDFVIDFMKNDSLGRIAHLHLAYAHDDTEKKTNTAESKNFRAFSDRCLKLASLHSCAVDFAKTGVPATVPLDYDRPSYPDFMEKHNKTSFESDSPLSHMYRRVKFSMTDYLMDQESYDNTMCAVPDMLEWLPFAKEKKQRYDLAVKRLMAQYAIKNETEVVTGFILSYEQQYTSKREFEVRMDVAAQYGAIRDSFRHEIDTRSKTDDDTGDLLTQHLADSRKEAIVAAMYDVTFADLVEIKDKSKAMLSFPWIFHDVIGRLSSQRSQRLYNEGRLKLSQDGTKIPTNEQLLDLLLETQLGRAQRPKRTDLK